MISRSSFFFAFWRAFCLGLLPPLECHYYFCASLSMTFMLLDRRRRCFLSYLLSFFTHLPKSHCLAGDINKPPSPKWTLWSFTLEPAHKWTWTLLKLQTRSNKFYSRPFLFTSLVNYLLWCQQFAWLHGNLFESRRTHAVAHSLTPDKLRQ